MSARTGAVADAARQLLAPGIARRALAMAMARGSGWSLPMAEWIIDATLLPLADEDAVAAWASAADARGDYAGRTVVVAGGAIPDPAVRSLAAAALLGGEVALKVCAREPVLAPAYAAALAISGGPAVTVHSWRGGSAGADGADSTEHRLYAGADRILAFGRAASIAAIRQHARPDCVFLGHGPRASVALVLDAYDDAGIAELAIDIARYDQRGCLSPQGLIVAGGDRERRHVTEQLGLALAELGRELPCGRGELADEVAWRLRVDSVLLWAIRAGVADPFDTDGETYMVHASRTGELELSPGGRIASVLALDDFSRASVRRALGAAADFIQGVAIVGADPALWQGFLGASHVARAGQLQTPPLAFRPDGLDPFQCLRE